jgi:hypothetical protein
MYAASCGGSAPVGSGRRPERVNEAWDLDACVRCEVRDQRAIVRDVADDPRLLAGDDRVDDHRRVLAAPLDLERLAGRELPLRLVELVEVPRDAAEVLADRDVEPFDLILRDEPGLYSA